MSYTVEISVFYRESAPEFFNIVEKGIWHYANGGTWTEAAGKQILTMGGSGTSGGLRFKSASGGDAFFIVVGVHNYSLWLDVLPNIEDKDTTVALLPTYYQPGSRAGIPLVQNITRFNETGRKIEFKKVIEEGRKITCSLIIS